LFAAALQETGKMCYKNSLIQRWSFGQMKSTDIVRAIDIQSFLDRLEQKSCVQNYYRINHLSPEQMEIIAQKMAESLLSELQKMGLRIDA